MSIMAIAIIPVAVSVHTIVSFDFSMAPVPMWHSTMFGPYLVAGAIFSGIAGLIIAMAALRKFLHIEEYLHPVHFQNLGKLLLMMSLLWGYFVFAERLTVWYGNESAEIQVLRATQKGSFAPLYWTMVVVNFVIPVTILSIRKPRTITGCVIASCGVLVGMWLERFLIVVPSLGHKYLPYSWGTYRPRPVEILITISTFAAMTLLYTLFASSCRSSRSGSSRSANRKPTKPRCNDPGARSGRRIRERGLRVVSGSRRRPARGQRTAHGRRRRGRHHGHVRRAVRGTAVRAARQGDVAV